MDTYIKYSFLIEIALIIVVLTLLYIAVYFYRKKPVKSIPEMAVKEIPPVEDEIISKLDRILAMIPVDYDSTLHSSDDDIKHHPADHRHRRRDHYDFTPTRFQHTRPF